MSSKETCKRCLGLGTALFLSALGIALITNANLGTTPISSLPYALSAVFGLSLGAFTFISNIFFVVLQKILLKNKFTVRHLFQLPTVLVFSIFIDLCMALTRLLVTDSYFLQLMLCVAGSAALALGISLEIIANVTVLPGEGLVIAIAYISNRVFDHIKVVFDLILVGIACLISLACLHEVTGLREGTVFCALLVGPLVRFFSRWTSKLNSFFIDGPASEET